MTSRERAASAAAGAAVIGLVALHVLLWTVTAMNRLPPSDYDHSPASNSTPVTSTAPSMEGYPLPGSFKATDNMKDNDVLEEYVIPLKLSGFTLHEDDTQYGPDDWSSVPISDETTGADPMHAMPMIPIESSSKLEKEKIFRLPTASTIIDSGHFRHRQAILWDTHPEYIFCAFGQYFHLLLAEDSYFMSPHLRVTQIWRNYTHREASPVRTEKCFYTGGVVGDPKSSVAVNLCDGMSGHIRTSSGNYLIEPIEPWKKHKKSMIHKISIVHSRKRNPNGSSSSFNCGLEGDDTHGIKNEGKQDLRRNKRAIRRSSGGRRKFISQREYFIQVMVVTDKKMTEHYGENLELYVLTLMSIVASLFRNASIGNRISFSVVNFTVLYKQEFVSRSSNSSLYNKEQMSGTSASDMRNLFCQWKNYFTSGPHVAALLLTRENICRNPSERKCDTLGLAELGTICKVNSSCAIVQDNGLGAAFTIAHEFGHMLNMPHDDGEGCKKFHGSENIMTSMLHNKTSPWSWSNCSRHFVTEFLEAGYGDCLLESPSKEYSFPDKMPGEIYSADQQCTLGFGEGFSRCPYMPVCRHLWCTKRGGTEGCSTKHVPWADGTACGNGTWCQRGSCVVQDREALKPVDGGWGSWEKFGECSRTCGGGVRRATRSCNNPPPVNIGRYCLGPHTKYQSCNTKDCPYGAKDFREVQCAAFNNNTFGNNDLSPYVKWVPKYETDPKLRCHLYCVDPVTNRHYRVQEKVIDGTPCGPDTFDICVNGLCKQAGCNHELGSKSKLDICGICNGNNSSCQLVTGSFNETVHGYSEVVRIPIGSINVDVQQVGYQGRSPDGNYLALVDESGEYIFNGGYILTNYHKNIFLNGTKLEYTGTNTTIERLTATKPLKQDLIIQVLSVDDIKYPPDITYKYVIRCQWRYTPWSECNKHCFGISYRVPYCSLLDRNEEIEEHYCSNMPKPRILERTCNNQCNIRWQFTTSECSVQCGRGNRSLIAHCIVEISANEVHQVDNRICLEHLNPPPTFEECEILCGHWKFGDWGSCSKTCGGGYQHRLVECVGNEGVKVNESLCNANQRVTTQKCAVSSCPIWKLGDWTPCSVTCGFGERHRPYWCNQDNRVVSPQFCNSQDPPLHREGCSLACSASWQQM